MGLTPVEEELRLAIATSYLEAKGSTLLYDHGGDLIKILQDNSTLVIRMLYEYRNRVIEEAGLHWSLDGPPAIEREDC
jgi:hypothetical protein